MSQIEQAIKLNFEAPIALHLAVVSFFVISGTIFNGLTIYLKLKKSNMQETDAYIVALACVDILQCITICPQYPFMAYYVAEYSKQRPFLFSQYMFCVTILIIIYLQLLTIIAFLRAYAVLKPYRFKSYIKRSFWVMASIVSLSVLNAVTFQKGFVLLTHAELIADIVMSLQVLVCFVILTISYIMIFIKLYKRSGKFETAIHLNDNKTIIKLNVSKSMRAVHVKTMQIFVIITLIFVVSFAPSIFIAFELYNNFNILYIQFFNHNTNFIIYMIFNADFKKDVYSFLERIRKLIERK